MDEMVVTADLGVCGGVGLGLGRLGRFVVGWCIAAEFQSELLPNSSHNAVSSNSTANPPYFFLLQKWLQFCDSNHTECHQRRENQNFWPTRVIFVGNPDKVNLVEKQIQGEDYLALSHCWGAPTAEEKNRFCTNRKNYQDRLQGFSYDELPKTFQHAVQVTRALQKQYLWIDALCIIQGDDGDWGTQAKTMANIFACAYCTIAASSAHGWGDGFLSLQTDPPDIRAPITPSILTCKCDFNKDVDDGALMKRAWVLQERVLSRRIIHFTTAHTYCECGDGVLCEQLTKLSPPFGKQYFVLDPNFPRRLTQSGSRRTADFIQFLFKKYSASHLTIGTDRDVAIDSLVERMAQVLKTEVRYGIFDCFRGSLLLWKRSEEDKTSRISYGDRTVPSWSWMAYSGGIDFLSDSSMMQSLVVPSRVDLGFTDDGKALDVKVRRFGETCRVEQQADGHIIVDGTEEVGRIWFDVSDRVEFKHCVAVGMKKYDWKENPRKIYYVLIVWKKENGVGYERLGVGMVEAQYVSRDGDAGTLW
ncbi:heterokaryon incompatibility protein-domain-containing protein [Immersiella caudata]|uniref:Heterokaryon incompatibility protein-domain-containing protein n=1 Tax=Immersiella caudata TaxID=314043 RepID=A0AA39WST4_9PEZI|nr:heterokaryon incompatibility protein-domain-containing protein [Immersiella caudata]